MSARDDYPVVAAHEKYGSAQFGKALNELDLLRADVATLLAKAARMESENYAAYARVFWRA